MANPATPYTQFSNSVRDTPPDVAFVLGSGLGLVARRLEDPCSLPFTEIPGLTETSVIGHRGCVTLGNWAGKRVLIFEGRLHHYEGHAWRSVTQPVRTAAFLGARVLVLTNAAGGIADFLEPQSLMVIRNHMEWNRTYWWREPGPCGIGPRRPTPYSARLRDLLHKAAGSLALTLNEGIYAAVTGPCYETLSEIRALQKWGAHAVGMSTTREVLAGREAGMECMAISCITNKAAGLSDGPINHKEVLVNAGAKADSLADLLEKFLTMLEVGPRPDPSPRDDTLRLDVS